MTKSTTNMTAGKPRTAIAPPWTPWKGTSFLTHRTIETPWRYTYAAEDPVHQVDPSGNAPTGIGHSVVGTLAWIMAALGDANSSGSTSSAGQATSPGVVYVFQTLSPWQRIPFNNTRLAPGWRLKVNNSASKQEILAGLGAATSDDIVVVFGHANFSQSQGQVVGMATDEWWGSQNVSGNEAGTAENDGTPPLATVLGGCQTDGLAYDAAFISASANYGTTTSDALGLIGRAHR